MLHSFSYPDRGFFLFTPQQGHVDLRSSWGSFQGFYCPNIEQGRSEMNSSISLTLHASQVMANEREGSIFLTNGIQPYVLIHRQEWDSKEGGQSKVTLRSRDLRLNRPIQKDQRFRLWIWMWTKKNLEPMVLKRLKLSHCGGLHLMIVQFVTLLWPILSLWKSPNEMQINPRVFVTFTRQSME